MGLSCTLAMVDKPLPSMESLISINAKEVSEISQVYLRGRMKRINSSYKLIEFLSGRRSGADTVVNVATVKFRFAMWFSVVYLINRFHVAVRLFSSRSQMTSKCGKDKKVAHEA